MKLLFDQNLSHCLSKSVAVEFPYSVHVRDESSAHAEQLEPVFRYQLPRFVNGLFPVVDVSRLPTERYFRNHAREHGSIILSNDHMISGT